MLLAILTVFSRNGAPARRSASALPLARAGDVAGGSARTPPAPQWTDVPVATSVAELGPALAQPVADGLAAARARINRCVAVEHRRRPPGAGAGGERAAVELVLRLAARSGAVHVVGVEVDAAGAPAVLADCAHRHLDGDAFPASGAVTGRRHRLLVSLP